MEEEYYSIKEVSKKLRIAYLTVYRWIQAKKLPAYKLGKQYRIEKLDLEKFINENKN